MNKFLINEALTNFQQAIEIYVKNDIHLGVIYPHLLGCYKVNKNYQKLIEICLQVEYYYLNNFNYKRLIHIYSYLSDYYELINNMESSEYYFDKIKEILNIDPNLERFRFIMYFNWGNKCFVHYNYDEAIKYYEKSLDSCYNDNYKFQIYLRIIMTMIKLNEDHNIIYQVIQESKLYKNNRREDDLLLYNYFKLKYKHQQYYRRYAKEKVIPYFKKDSIAKHILQFIYEDLYKID